MPVLQNNEIPHVSTVDLLKISLQTATHFSFSSQWCNHVIAMMAVIAFGWYHLPPLPLFPLKDKGVTVPVQRKSYFY